jgi:hypothetical protein
MRLEIEGTQKFTFFPIEFNLFLVVADVLLRIITSSFYNARPCDIAVEFDSILILPQEPPGAYCTSALW